MVAVSPATAGPAVQAVYATGAVEPVTWAKVAPLVRGRIVELCACEGDEVARDHVLARLDDTEARAELAELEARAMDILDELGMAKHAHRRPDQLSGGERQSVAIARSLANNPLMILADEPTGNLDSKNAANVFAIFSKLTEVQGKSVVVITHDQDLAALTERQIQTLDGRIVQDSAVSRPDTAPAG